MDRPLQCRISPSKIAQFFCITVLLLSCLAIVLADISLCWQVLLVLLVGCLTWHAIQTVRRPLVQCIGWQAGQWRIVGRGLADDVAVGSEIFFVAGLISLSFSLPSGKKRQVLLWPDSADAESLRCLRRILLQ